MAIRFIVIPPLFGHLRKPFSTMSLTLRFSGGPISEPSAATGCVRQEWA
jgi:hypothetical protein